MKRNLLLVALGFAGCVVEPDLVDSVESEVVVPQTAVESVLTPNWYSRYDGGFELLNVAAYANISTRDRYVVAGRRKTAPYALEYFLIDGSPGSANYGKKVSGITQPLCGGSSCSAIDLYGGGTTWPVDAGQSRSVFVYTSDLWPGQSGDPSNPNWGYALMRASTVTATGAHSYQDLHDCRNFSPTGGPLPPDCKIKAVSHASSTRRNGTDKVLVTYLIANNIAVNDWRLGAILFTPGGAQVNLPPVKYCSEPACAHGDFFILQSRTAYNALENKFLVVFAVWPTASVVRGYGQIYDGTTGAPVGAPIDLGPVGTPFPVDQQYAGVASNPNLAQNPNREWVVFLDNKRYHVRPNGTVTSSALAPGVEVGNWTLQWISTPDGRDYERFTDYGPGTTATSERYNDVPGASVNGAVAVNANTYAESLAMKLTSGNSLALWSGQLCFPGIPCGGGLQWRVIDH